MDINIFLDESFVCSTADNREFIYGGNDVDITLHKSLFDLYYLRQITGKLSAAECISDFICDKKFRIRSPNYLFDVEFYGSHFSKTLPFHLIIHYILIGDKLNISPNRNFSQRWYREQYAVKESTCLGDYLSNQHWRSPNPFFDPIWYFDHNVDVYRAGKEPFKHYIAYGKKEGRSPHALVDLKWYSKKLGQDVSNLGDFFANRWRNFIFPHPLARANWSSFSTKELEDLFTVNLSSFPRLKVENSGEKWQLIQQPSIQRLHSIDSRFKIAASIEYEQKLIQAYRSKPSLPETLVSIIIPTKNRLSKLKLAVESLLLQVHKMVEIIVVDDGGSDGTAEWLKGHKDDRIKLVTIAASGVSAARNAGLDVASGKYVAFLDSDNAMTPNFIASMLAHSDNTGSILSYGALRLYNEKNQVRYRFKSYNQETYWKTNYIDMNVLFHKREDFSHIRFDDSLKRCVDWDYILRLAAVATPDAVNVIGCDYYHDGSGFDRITLQGPVWDCFRVSQKNRPVRARKHEDMDIIIYPVTKERIDFHIANIAMSLTRIPVDLKVQVVLPVNLDNKDYQSIHSLLVSSGHPEPAMTHMPLDFGAMVDYGIYCAPFIPRVWHIVDTRIEHLIYDVAYRALSATDPTIYTRDGNDGFDALFVNYDSQLLERVVAKAERVGEGVVPLTGSVVNIPASRFENLDLRYSGKLSVPFLIASLHSDQEVAIVTIDGSSLDVDLANVDSALHIFNLDNGLDQYHSLKSLTSDLKVKKSDSYVSSSSLSVIHHRARLIGKERLAVYTPAPHPGCGWGDEFYGISLVDAFQQVGLDAELVYRKDWKNAAGQFSDIVHLRGIVKISPVSTARNYMWLISHPDDVGEDELSACDSVFVASEPFSKRLTIEQNRVIDFLPQCSSFHPLDPRENIYADDLRPFAVFVGDSKKVLRYPIDELVKKWSRLFLFGPNWNGVERLGSRYFPGVLANQLLPQIYSSFGAVLNQHWGDMARSGFVSKSLIQNYPL